MLVVGDKIKLKKSMGAFTNIGEVCEVIGITEEAVISFRFGGFHMGCMSYDEFEKYFDKVEAEEKKKAEEALLWSDWVEAQDERNEYYRYKTNTKKVIVKKDGKTARATCHNNDDFNLEIGLRIALKRVNLKIAKFNYDVISMHLSKWASDFLEKEKELEFVLEQYK